MTPDLYLKKKDLSLTTVTEAHCIRNTLTTFCNFLNTLIEYFCDLFIKHKLNAIAPREIAETTLVASVISSKTSMATFLLDQFFLYFFLVYSSFVLIY